MAKKNTPGVKKPLGHSLSRLRKRKKLSIEELSELTGLSASHLEEIEAGTSFAPVGDMLKIARALTVDPDELLRSGSEMEKEKNRVNVFTQREQAYRYEVLTPGAKRDHLRAFRVVIPPRSEHPSVNYRHEGEEFVYVLRGEVEIEVGNRKNHLTKDESIHFNSSVRHALKNPGNSTTVLIVTIYTP
ncbi:MAG: cupin domain-containing protein [Spirochaetes bacterium]|nr:cupin domain-containing protein [Spirochaetota bacterium]